MKQPKVRGGPDGLYFFDRDTGVNILLDEIEVPQADWATAPRQVSIALTNACDLHCPYCYAPKHSTKLSITRITAWLDELDNNGTVGVGFGGGEPTLYPSLADICQYAAQKTGLAVSFTTHAHHLNTRLVQKLKGNVHFLRVSMDGIGRTYETLRGKSFQAFIKQLNYVREIAPFGINFVVNIKTIHDLDNAVAIAHNEGAAEFLLLPEQPVLGIGGINGETMHTLRAWVSAYRGRMRISISDTCAENFPVCNPFSKESGLFAYAHIDADGVLKRSSYDLKGVPIGGGSVIKALQNLKKQTGGQL
jgi:MoaA/NifB/PqqE/SkfB family radical SAM enzyme